MPKHQESKLQQSCVKWFDYQYPQYRMNLFAIPNGGRRGKLEAGIMKGEGVRAGVADMFLAVNYTAKPISKDGKWYGTKPLHSNGLFIEFKFGTGKQSDNQLAFQDAVMKHGYLYEVISDFDSFKNLIEQYLN